MSILSALIYTSQIKNIGSNINCLNIHIVSSLVAHDNMNVT